MKIGTMIFASPTNNSFLSQVLEIVRNDKDFDVRVKPQLSSTTYAVVESTSRIAYYPNPYRVRGPRRGGRAVECTGLENRHRLIAYPGFESLPLRHLIGSPLSSAELEAIKAGLESKTVHEVANDLRSSLNEASLESGDGLHLTLLQYLIAEDFLDIKLCLRENGLHHQKTRIAKDVLGNTVVTLGSDNDSRSALGGNNRESGNLHANWLISEDEWARNAKPALKKFELDWHNKNPNSVSVPLDEQIRLGIKEDWQDRNISPDDLLAKLRALYKKLRHVNDVEKFVLRPHQERAKDAWQNNNWKGILAHCTGAGKTITSLYCSYKLADQYRHNNKGVLHGRGCSFSDSGGTVGESD